MEGGPSRVYRSFQGQYLAIVLVDSLIELLDFSPHVVDLVLLRRNSDVLLAHISHS